jgi:hypothetical protein
MLKTFLLCMTVAMLSRYLSSVNRRIRNAKGNFTHKVNYRYYCNFQACKLFSYLQELEDLQSQGPGDGRTLKRVYLLENYIGTDDCQCYIRGRCP